MSTMLIRYHTNQLSSDGEKESDSEVMDTNVMLEIVYDVVTCCFASRQILFLLSDPYPNATTNRHDV
ncbi:Hypothetical predicted protein [Octopus vulgaris]|uniref:Uncharacterized protein n=1 Tax=Octopus vulgaris TaxID=6645 RepID=A0AA36F7L3_OCTVU|nr:Hypothetical predicted protein [Octopus vulgaris]